MYQQATGMGNIGSSSARAQLLLRALLATLVGMQLLLPVLIMADLDIKPVTSFTAEPATDKTTGVDMPDGDNDEDVNDDNGGEFGHDEDYHNNEDARLSPIDFQYEHDDDEIVLGQGSDDLGDFRDLGYDEDEDDDVYADVYSQFYFDPDNDDEESLNYSNENGDITKNDKDSSGTNANSDGTNPHADGSKLDSTSLPASDARNE